MVPYNPEFDCFYRYTHIPTALFDIGITTGNLLPAAMDRINQFIRSRRLQSLPDKHDNLVLLRDLPDQADWGKQIIDNLLWWGNTGQYSVHVP